MRKSSILSSLALVFVMSSSMASEDLTRFRSFYEVDSDGVYSEKTSIQLGKEYHELGFGFNQTTNLFSPFILYKEYGVYLNKAPYIFFEKDKELPNKWLMSYSLDSFDYVHTDEYDKNLWIGSLGFSRDVDAGHDQILAVAANFSYISDGYSRSHIRLNYSIPIGEKEDGLNFLAWYRNVTNSDTSPYYYSPKEYNSFQIGLSKSFSFMTDYWMKLQLTVGKYSTNTSSGNTLSFASTTKLSKTTQFIVKGFLEDEYSYGYAMLKFDF